MLTWTRNWRNPGPWPEDRLGMVVWREKNEDRGNVWGTVEGKVGWIKWDFKRPVCEAWTWCNKQSKAILDLYENKWHGNDIETEIW